MSLIKANQVGPRFVHKFDWRIRPVKDPAVLSLGSERIEFEVNFPNEESMSQPLMS